MATLRIEFGLDAATLKLANAVLPLLQQLMELGMVDLLTQLEAEVGNNTTLEGSIETLVGNFVAAAQAASPNNPRLQGLLDTMKANDSRLAALVIANTPVASPAPVIPDPVVV